jgi:hypothetical protein
MSFAAPSDTFPLPTMCLEVRAMNLSYGDQAMRALCRARHTEYVQEPLSDGKTKFIVRIHIWGLFRLGSCHLRQRTGEKVRHRILQFTQREKGCHKHKAYFVSCTDLEWDYPYIPATKEMDKR